MTTNTTTIVISSDNSRAKLGLTQTGAMVERLAARTKKATDFMGRNFADAARTVFNLKTAVLGLAGTASIGLIGRSFLDASSSIETYKATLDAVSGSSSKAERDLAWIKKFAADTPYEVDRLTESFVKLAAYGLDGTKHLKTLGDTAAALGKDINMAVEALADAQTGEFERLKEFGVKAVEITKKNHRTLGAEIESVGLTALTYVDKNGQEQIKIIDRNNREMITSQLTAIWNERYEGAMAKRMSTWEGMLSNLSDEWFNIRTDFMQDSGLFDYAKAGLASLLGDIKTFKKDAGFQDWAKESGNWIISTFESAALSVAGFVDRAIPILVNIKDEAKGLWNTYDTVMPDWAKPYGLVGAILLGRYGIAGVAVYTKIIQEAMELGKELGSSTGRFEDPTRAYKREAAARPTLPPAQTTVPMPETPVPLSFEAALAAEADSTAQKINKVGEEVNKVAAIAAGPGVASATELSEAINQVGASVASSGEQVGSYADRIQGFFERLHKNYEDIQKKKGEGEGPALGDENAFFPANLTATPDFSAINEALEEQFGFIDELNEKAWEKKQEQATRELERLDMQLADEEDRLFASTVRREEMVYNALDMRIITAERAALIIEQIEKDHEKKILKIREKGMTAWEKASKKGLTSQAKYLSKYFMDISSMSASSSRTMFELNKAASIAGATLDAYKAITGAYKVGASIGGPPLGAAFAAAAGVAQFATISSIMSTSYGGGGGYHTPAGGQPITGKEISAPSELASGKDEQTEAKHPVVINIYQDNVYGDKREVARDMIAEIREAIGDGL